MKTKNVTALLMASLLAASTLTACGKKTPPKGEVDNTKTQLYVNTYDGGTGDNWLNTLARKFEEEYKDHPFVDGKVGVQVHVDASRNNTSAGLAANMKNSDYSVSIAEEFYYSQCMAGDLLYDITDLLDDELTDGSGTIADKLYQEQKDYLTAYNGNYHALPWLAVFNGFTYDAALFEENGLWFADTTGYKPRTDSSYTGTAYTGRGFVTPQNQKKSPGPDGKYGTLDDGLPSSYEEWFYLFDYMVKNKGIDPIIYTGASAYYMNYTWQSLLMAWAGKDEMATHFTFDSNGKDVRVITGWNGNEPIVESVKITKENGYLIKQQEALYYTLKFYKHLYGNTDYFYAGSASKSFTNLAAQTIFVESSLNPNYTPIAMIAEGNYWYNEASAALTDSENIYGARAKNRDFRLMPMPGQELGTVNENQGKPTAISDAMNYTMVVNNNIKGNAEKEAVAKEFVKFCYRDDNLQTATSVGGIPIAVDYEMPENVYSSMPKYKQSLWDLYDTAKDSGDFLAPVGGNLIYLSNPNQFGFSIQASFFHSIINGLEESKPQDAFATGKSIKDYLEGMKISQSDWTTKFNVSK